jgi:carboxymethylenebutenolidase
MTTTATVQIPVADGTTMPAYLARPAGGPAGTGVIVAHELFGVNPDIRGVADDLAGAGYLTIAPEFYHRDAPPGRWLDRDEDGREEGFKLLHRLAREQAVADAAAGIGWLRSQPQIGRIAMVGFSAGGHLSYLAACRLPIEAAAVLYGGWLPGTDIPMSQPTPTLDLTPGITGRLVYLVGEDDALIDAGQRGQIRAALHAAGIEHELVSYPGTGHAFFWPGTPAFRRAPRDDAWSRILAMLAKLAASVDHLVHVVDAGRVPAEQVRQVDDADGEPDPDGEAHLADGAGQR